MPENSATSKHKLKVGIECESIEEDSWGIARVITKLLEEISFRPELAREFEFHLYFKSKVPDYAFLQNPIFKKKIVRVPFIPASFSLYYYVWLPIRLWFEQLNVMFFPNYMLPLIFSGTSLVLLTDDIYYESRNPKLPFRYRLAYRIFAGWAAQQASRLIAISDTSKRELIRLYGIKPGRISVNYLGIEQPHQVSENKHGNYVLFVGQAFPRRHVAETLRAFEIIAPEFPHLKFIAVGPDKYSPPFIRQLQLEINSHLGRERVLYFERVTDEELSDLYAHAQALTYISSREAFGLPPLEALAYGAIPVVADNALGHELLGEHAFFVPHPNSVQSIAETLRDGLSNTEKRAAIKAASSTIQQRYTWKAHANRFLDLIRAMA